MRESGWFCAGKKRVLHYDLVGVPKKKYCKVPKNNTTVKFTLRSTGKKNNVKFTVPGRLTECKHGGDTSH